MTQLKATTWEASVLIITAALTHLAADPERMNAFYQWLKAVAEDEPITRELFDRDFYAVYELFTDVYGDVVSLVLSRAEQMTPKGPGY